MKKLFSAVLAGTLLMSSGMALAHSGVHVNGFKTESKGLSVSVNGVQVGSNLNHIHNAKIYVDVQAFANLFGKSFQFNAANNTVSFNGKAVSDVRVVNGHPTAWVKELGNAVGAQKVTWFQESKEVYVLALPEGTINLEPGTVTPAMGEHWANPQDMPVGPIYGVQNGRLVFLEYMISQKDFATGVSYPNLFGMKGVPSPAVVQTDIEFEPNGHPGFTIPHYDLHAYFISNKEQHQIGDVSVELKNDKGENIGYASLAQMGPVIFMKVTASGLTPGKHGFHIHDAAIANNDFSTAKGHYNPTGGKHGAHAGDIPNLVVGENGSAAQTYIIEGIKLEDLIGKSLVIHAGEDDGVTDPAGNAGARVAGGNIVLKK